MLVCHRLHPPVLFSAECQRADRCQIVPRKPLVPLPLITSGYLENAARKRFPREGEDRSVLVKKERFSKIPCRRSQQSAADCSASDLKSCRKRSAPASLACLTNLALRVACDIHAQLPESRTRYVLVLARRDLLQLPWQLLLGMSRKAL